MTCKNCKTLLNTEQSYCFKCGAKVIKNRLTIKNLSADFSEQFFSYDNKFLATFLDLFKKPEDVIGGYIDGLRKKYINVVQYLAISITILGIQYFIISTINSDYFVPEPSEFDEQMSKLYPKEALENVKKMMMLMNEYMSLIYLTGIPFSAMITWITFLKERTYNFTEHIVINMYVTAQYIIGSALLYLLFFALDININILITLVTVLYVIYFGFVFKQLYQLSIPTLILRFMYSIVLFIIQMIIIIILMTLIMVVYVKFFK